MNSYSCCEVALHLTSTV